MLRTRSIQGALRLASSRRSKVAMVTMRTMATNPVDTTAAVVEEATKTIPPLELTTHPFDVVCHFFEYIHTTGDMSYLSAIVLGTIVVRTSLIPLFVKVSQNGAKMQLAAPEIEKYKQYLNEASDQHEKTRIMEEMMGVYKKNDVNPLRSLILPFFQMPIFISMFFGLQRMGDYFPDFANGGYGWFVDLSTQDPTYILPVANAISFLLVSETNSELDAAQQGPMMRTFFRAIAVAMPFVTCAISKGVFVYWITNNTYSMLQGAAFRNHSVKRMFNIPIVPINNNTKK